MMLGPSRTGATLGTLAAVVLASAAIACGALLGISPPPDAADAGADGRAPDPPADGASADAPRGDAAKDGPVDSGADAPAPVPYWTFADDFETGDLRRWPTPNSSSNGVIGVVDAGAFAGCCALHVAVDAGAVGYQNVVKNWTAETPAVPPVTSGTMAMRARIRAIKLDRDTRELMMNRNNQTPNWYANAGFGNDGPGPSWGFILGNPSYPVGGGYNRQSPNVIADALGGWHCVEFIVSVSGPAGHLAIFLDDQPTPQIQGDADTTVDNGWDAMAVGLGFSSGASASEVFLDDVRLALYRDMSPTIHVGCK